MPSYQLPYGNTLQTLNVPEQFQVDIIHAPEVPPSADPLTQVETALDHSLDDYRLDQFAGVESVAIAINDKTRPAPHEHLLPPLLARLERLGVRPEAIELIVATGSHLPMPSEEFPKILPPEILSRYKVSSHDCDDPAQLVHLGTTPRGTPVLANRRYMRAGLRIVVGNIEPHHFMGFSGGVKSAAIGLVSRQTINANHAMLPDPHCSVGLYEQNPMRMDVEEIGKIIGVHFALNTIQDSERRIIRALAGHPLAVMRAGVDLSRQFCQVQIDRPYDLVFTSPGGYPKDINLYQAQKALTHGALIAKDGASVVLVAECREGPGSASLEAYMQSIASLQDAFEQFDRHGFQIGPHKAFQIAKIAERVKILLVSQMSEALARKYFFTPAPDAQTAWDRQASSLPAAARIAILPSATHTIPILSAQETV